MKGRLLVLSIAYSMSCSHVPLPFALHPSASAHGLAECGTLTGFDPTVCLFGASCEAQILNPKP